MNRESLKVSQNVAAGIAHELRNPVLGIASAAQLIRYRIADDPVVEKNIGRILRETDRLNTLIAALLEYGRPAPAALEVGDPDGVWDAVLLGHRGSLESKALLVQHSSTEPRAACRIDAEQLGDACSHALANAIEAAAEGSDLTIVSRVTDAGTWESQLTNAGAMAQDILTNAFEPLVTNKPGHAGLGLAATHRILTEHGGTATLESDGRSSTTLTFTLPLASAP